MKTPAPAVAVVLLILAVNSGNSEAVQVQVDGLSFSLEDVRTLQTLTQTPSEAENASPRLRASSGSVCSNPALPKAFQPLCDHDNKAFPSLMSLTKIPLDVCEICAIVSCTGCQIQHS